MLHRLEGEQTTPIILSDWLRLTARTPLLLVAVGASLPIYPVVTAVGLPPSVTDGPSASRDPRSQSVARVTCSPVGPWLAGG